MGERQTGTDTDTDTDRERETVAGAGGTWDGAAGVAQGSTSMELVPLSGSTSAPTGTHPPQCVRERVCVCERERESERERECVCVCAHP